MKRATPRERVAAHLEDLGIIVYPEDIITLEGAWRHRRMDCLDHWTVYGIDAQGKRVEITGINTLTKCQRGIVLKPNERGSPYYGDFTAEPKPRAS
jgi:hypothetical protein